VNGVEVHEVDDVFLPLAKCRAGEKVSLEISRRKNQFPKTFEATLAKYAVQGKVIAANRQYFRGLRVDYTSLLIQPPLQPLNPDFNFSKVPTGVLVAEVVPNSRADDVLKVGQVITHVNGKEILTPADFYKEVKDLNDSVELTLLNGDKKKIN
jgi:S1-C subfamily serine protease